MTETRQIYENGKLKAQETKWTDNKGNEHTLTQKVEYDSWGITKRWGSSKETVRTPPKK
jgi:hypothetical protein